MTQISHFSAIKWENYSSQGRKTTRFQWPVQYSSNSDANFLGGTPPPNASLIIVARIYCLFQWIIKIFEKKIILIFNWCVFGIFKANLQFLDRLKTSIGPSMFKTLTSTIIKESRISLSFDKLRLEPGIL